MGESVKLRNGLAGGFSLNDFLKQGDSQATTRRLLRTMLPVQEMRDFQRRYLFDTGSQSLFAAERISLLSWTVPANENWKPLALLYQNGDSGTHQVLTAFTMSKNPADLVYQPSRTLIRANSTKIVYGSVWDASNGAANEQHYSSPIYVTMEPSDRFDLIDESANTGASVQRWTFVYELVPAPSTARTPGVEAAVTVV